MSNNILHQVQQVVLQAEAQGWQRRDTSHGNSQLFAPDHKSIVSTPGTHASGTDFKNFVSKLKHHGFTPMTDHDELLMKRTRGKTADVICAYLDENAPTTFSTQEIIVAIRSRLQGSVTSSAVAQALLKRVKVGRIVRLGYGMYRSTITGINTVKEKGNGVSATPVMEAIPEFPILAEVVKPIELSHIANESDSDRVINNLLTAIADFEVLVKFNKDVAKRLIQIKADLNKAI